MAGALDYLLAQLGGDGQQTGSIEEQMRPRQTPAKTDFWDLLRKQYGAAPPDQITGPYQQIFGKAFQGQGERPLFTGEPITRSPLYDTDAPPSSPGAVETGRAAYPTLHGHGYGWDKSLPPDFVWNDAPPSHYYFPDGQPHPVPQPRDPWAMLKTAPLNQMFGSRRIPGLY